MSQFEFMKYEATPGEKHLGIATVKAFGKIVLRYKIVPNKDGSGFFPASASYKMPKVGDEDVYIGAFLLDSRSDEEEMNALIRAGVKGKLTAQVANPSAFAPAPSNFSEDCPF